MLDPELFSRTYLKPEPPSRASKQGVPHTDNIAVGEIATFFATEDAELKRPEYPFFLREVMPSASADEIERAYWAAVALMGCNYPEAAACTAAIADVLENRRYQNINNDDSRN